MTTNPQRAGSVFPEAESGDPLELTNEQIVSIDEELGQPDWAAQTAEATRAGGRRVLGVALALLAALWIAYGAWSAGRNLAGQPLASPAVAQWIAISTRPARPSRPDLADVRPHPSQGSRAI